MTAGDPDDREADGEAGAPGTCEVPDCPDSPAVRLHVPWDDDRTVCPAHARVLSRPDGVVAEPIEGRDAEWP